MVDWFDVKFFKPHVNHFWYDFTKDFLLFKKNYKTHLPSQNILLFQISRIKLTSHQFTEFLRLNVSLNQDSTYILAYSWCLWVNWLKKRFKLVFTIVWILLQVWVIFWLVIITFFSDQTKWVDLSLISRIFQSFFRGRNLLFCLFLFTRRAGARFKPGHAGKFS